jgi:hypothetical protein
MVEPDRNEREEAVSVIESTLANCENMTRKFPEGSPQHTLLRNRIKALRIAKALLTDDPAADYSVEELKEALPPVMSIIGKTAKAQAKYEKGGAKFNRFEPLLRAMQAAKACIEGRIGGRQP